MERVGVEDWCGGWVVDVLEEHLVCLIDEDAEALELINGVSSVDFH